jgi:AraC-like DNA-binding protein
MQATHSNLRHQTRLACGLIPLLNFLQHHGVDTKDILAYIGIRKIEFIDPAFTIALEQELKIVEKALNLIDRPQASLELATYYHLHNFSALGLALRSCATLGDIFELIRRYPRLQWGICETLGEQQGENIVFTLLAGDNRVERFLLERDMACVKTLFSEALNDEMQLIEVCFSHAAPDNREAYSDFFNCPVLFNQTASTLTFSLSELARKIPTADALSREFYEAQCARLSAEMDDPFRYTYLIRDQLSRLTPIPNQETLSQLLDIETRTLQRLLKKEGETYSNILKEVRFKRASDRLLFSRLNTEEIAQELGFNDAVAFSHAFKQWTGLAPRQWREHTLNSKNAMD